MNVVELLRFENHVIPVVDDKVGKFFYVSNMLKEALQSSTASSKGLSRVLTEAKANHEAKLKSVSNSEMELAIARYYENKVIETTNDLGLKPDFHLVEDLIPDSEELQKHIAIVRPSEKSEIAYIYLSQGVRENRELVDIYRNAKSSVEMLDWCVQTRNLLAKETVIATIYQQSRLRTTSKILDSQSTSKARSNARDLLMSAIERNASDIHIDHIFESMGQVRFRIDKRLSAFNSYSSKDLESMLRILYGDGNNVTGIGFNPSLPQKMDIPFNASIGGSDKSYTLRWQSIPKDGGLRVVIRLLNNDPSSIQALTFQGMGYADQHQSMFLCSASNKKGFIITTGTTGSGKSTTNLRFMYEMLKQNPHWAFYTVEDPIEYRIEGACQISVQESFVEGSFGHDEHKRRKMAFEEVLRGLMRQDPDVIGIGEIRDETTATIVKDFVETGHKMIATLHADSALFVFDRLSSIGISKETMCRPGFFSLIVYQTLQPKVCKHCSLPFNKGSLSKVQKEALSAIFNGETGLVRIHNPDGCDHCNSGIKGMTVCSEMLQPDNTLLQYIRQNDYVSAEDYWLNRMPNLDPAAEYQGKTVVDHTLYKIKQGELCPVVCLEELPDFVQLLRSGRDYSFLHKGGE